MFSQFLHFLVLITCKPVWVNSELKLIQEYIQQFLYAKQLSQYIDSQ